MRWRFFSLITWRMNFQKRMFLFLFLRSRSTNYARRLRSCWDWRRENERAARFMHKENSDCISCTRNADWQCTPTIGTSQKKNVLRNNNRWMKMCSLLWPNGKGLSVVMLCIFVTVNKSNQNEIIKKMNWLLLSLSKNSKHCFTLWHFFFMIINKIKDLIRIHSKL